MLGGRIHRTIASFGLAASFAACTVGEDPTTSSTSAASSASTGSSSGPSSSSSAAGASSTNGASSTGAATSAGTTGTTGGSSTGSSTGTTTAAPSTYVYIESNDPTSSTSNSILAFQRSGDTLVPLTPVASFPLGGSGQGNPTQIVNGPDDSDQEVIFDAAHQRLYAVNQGSSTIAVLDINADGSLTAIAGSPFPSGGDGPVSLALRGDILYVVNMATDQAVAPNYTALAVGADGSLSPITGFKPITTSVGASPSQNLITPDGLHMFGSDFLGPVASRPLNPLRSFTFTSDGGLIPAPGDPYLMPTVKVNGGNSVAADLALGLAVHPTESILYVGFPLVSQVGAYSYDPTGVLTFVTSAQLTGITVCWLRVAPDGRRLYAINTSDASVSVLDIGTPRQPVEVEHFLLKDSVGLIFNQGGPLDVTSAPYQEAVPPDGTALFIVSQRVTTNASDTTSPGNILHTLTIAADGTVSEPGADIWLDVPLTARPQGVVTVQLP